MPDSASQTNTRKPADAAVDPGVREPGQANTRLRYNAFISYSHAVDHQFAADLQNGIQRFAAPWNPLRWLNPVRTLRIFRDESSLAANPALWQSIEQALVQSKWLIVLASQDAAQSPWIEKEIDFWCRHKSADRILFVLTSDEIAWDSKHGDFDWKKTSALPACLAGVFDAEPRWIDMRWAQALTQQYVQDLSFSKDGRYLATAGNDNFATLWLWQPEDLISKACERLTRNLSTKEWQDYLGHIPYQKTCSHLPAGE